MVTYAYFKQALSGFADALGAHFRDENTKMDRRLAALEQCVAELEQRNQAKEHRDNRHAEHLARLETRLQQLMVKVKDAR